MFHPRKGMDDIMSEKQSIYACMNTKGRVCQACGRRAVNGKVSTIVRTVLMLIAIVIIFVTYFIENNNTRAYLIMTGTIVAAWLLSMLFDAFFCPLMKVVRNDAS